MPAQRLMPTPIAHKSTTAPRSSSHSLGEVTMPRLIINAVAPAAGCETLSRSMRAVARSSDTPTAPARGRHLGHGEDQESAGSDRRVHERVTGSQAQKGQQGHCTRAAQQGGEAGVAPSGPPPGPTTTPARPGPLGRTGVLQVFPHRSPLDSEQVIATTALLRDGRFGKSPLAGQPEHSRYPVASAAQTSGLRHL